MKISYNWLKTFIPLEQPLEEICEMLTMSGLEVEHVYPIENIKGGLKGLIVGEVLEKQKHPNADKLNLTKVDIGNETPLAIVCGAKNVEVGQKVIVAPVGAFVHPVDGERFEIKKAKIRGEVSEGMICAEDEIGLGSGHEGIMVLDSKNTAGAVVADLYDVKTDYQIEIAIIPNRGDAISHLGVARELQALTGLKYKKPSLETIDARGQMKVEVAIENQEGCPRYSGITISNVTISESPAWLKERLQSIDLKPINNVVDITNFIQHELGQPLHAFDYDLIDGKRINVRNANSGEVLT
ncbi:MAG: phenylalanine--tRNA ligase subunit beta, partial [Bacteroidia bacterium]|nr:phenylalanine--tRNA ligase subunit beta [Bacteroidia bacterium]